MAWKSELMAAFSLRDEILEMIPWFFVKHFDDKSKYFDVFSTARATLSVYRVFCEKFIRNFYNEDVVNNLNQIDAINMEYFDEIYKDIGKTIERFKLDRVLSGQFATDFSKWLKDDPKHLKHLEHVSENLKWMQYIRNVSCGTFSKHLNSATTKIDKFLVRLHQVTEKYEDKEFPLNNITSEDMLEGKKAVEDLQNTTLTLVNMWKAGIKCLDDAQYELELFDRKRSKWAEFLMEFREYYNTARKETFAEKFKQKVFGRKKDNKNAIQSGTKM